jgi:hypothetical protein
LQAKGSPLKRLSLKTVLMIDLTLLIVAKRIVDMLYDWMAIRRRWVEWALAVTYMGAFAVASFWQRDWSGVALAGFVGLTMWYEIRKPKTVRMMRLVDIVSICARVLVTLMVGFFVTLMVLAPPHRLVDIPYAISQMAYLGFMYVTVLPDRDGERGRKAKMAFSKLKELFGTSWVPQPVPVPR